MPSATCIWCGEPLKFIMGRGWVHPEGGLYKMRCDSCRWSGAPYPSPRHCPNCGSGGLRDDHIARPDRSKEATHAT